MNTCEETIKQVLAKIGKLDRYEPVCWTERQAEREYPVVEMDKAWDGEYLNITDVIEAVKAVAA